jgi:hypothetical protein
MKGSPAWSVGLGSRQGSQHGDSVKEGSQCGEGTVKVVNVVRDWPSGHYGQFSWNGQDMNVAQLR